MLKNILNFIDFIWGDKNTNHNGPNCHASIRSLAIKGGFTLAEVLITLTILGVVAAVTIPSIINHYEQRVTVTKVKKMYSTLTTAYDQLLVNNNWVVQNYNASQSNAMYTDFVEPYMQVSVNAGKDSTEKKKIMYNGTYKYLHGTNPSAVNYSGNNNYYAVQLKDGSVLWFIGKSSGTADVPTFRYDINGKKDPNTSGKDLFFFSMTDKGIVPGISDTYQTPQVIAANCKKEVDEDDNDNAKSGSACAAYIIVHGNMNYLK